MTATNLSDIIVANATANKGEHLIENGNELKMRQLISKGQFVNL